MEENRKKTENPQAAGAGGEEGHGTLSPGYWWRVIRALLFIVLVIAGCAGVTGLGFRLAQALQG